MIMTDYEHSCKGSKRKLNISYRPKPLNYNFDEVEFNKGDIEFQNKLYENMKKEKQTKYSRYFPNFEYKNQKFYDTRQALLQLMLTKNQIQGQQGLPKPQQKTLISLSPVQMVKGLSNIKALTQSSFKQLSQCKRFNTEVDMSKLIKKM